MAGEIKLCPFCVSKHIPTASKGNTGRYQYVCSLCGARGPKADTLIEALGAWNRRADGGEREKVARLLEAASDVGLYAQEDGHGYHCRTEDIEKLARAVEEFEK